MIKTNRCLVQLDVSGNAFGPEGGRLIREALEHNDVLRAIDVRQCGMGMSYTQNHRLHHKPYTLNSDP